MSDLVPPDYDSFYIDSEFHDVVTFALGELWKLGWFDLKDESWDFPKFSDEQHERLCKKILDHYYMRNIGVLPLAAWKREFLRKMNEIMPKYIVLYKKVEEKPDMFNATDEYYKSRNVMSDFPQTQLSGNQDYASIGNDKQYERVKDGSILELSEKLQSFDDIDLQIVNELECLFSCMLTVNLNNW